MLVRLVQISVVLKPETSCSLLADSVLKVYLSALSIFARVRLLSFITTLGVPFKLHQLLLTKDKIIIHKAGATDEKFAI